MNEHTKAYEERTGKKAVDLGDYTREYTKWLERERQMLRDQLRRSRETEIPEEEWEEIYKQTHLMGG